LSVIWNTRQSEENPWICANSGNLVFPDSGFS
jgi:hypothetical protein